MVQKTPGRRRAFDTQAALTAAMEVFWKKGYAATSLDDLTSAMGINRPSLYNAFGDKQALFLKALDQYGKSYGSYGLTAFLKETTPQVAVREFLRISLENNTREGNCARGCMIMSCAIPAKEEIEEVSRQVHLSMTKTEELVADHFESMKQTGVLPSNFSVDTKTRDLLDMIYAQSFRTRAGEQRDKLASEINRKVDAILS